MGQDYFGQLKSRLVAGFIIEFMPGFTGD